MCFPPLSPCLQTVTELRKFLFDGLPVRGSIVRITDAWQSILARRAANTDTGPYPAPVRALLGEMVAAGVLMQSSIQFNGALVLQISGDGPVRLAVAEVQSNLALRATATLHGSVPVVADGSPGSAVLHALVNTQGQGRCVITLDPRDRRPDQQPYQGIVALVDAQGRPLPSLSAAIGHYMLRSEQLDTTLILAADDRCAAGLLLQRMPAKGIANLSAATESESDARDGLGVNEDFYRLATLAESLTREELLTLPLDTLLHRLFWQEKLLQLLDPATKGSVQPHFACTCSRERVATMLRSLGQIEVEDVLRERGQVEVGCDYCGAQYRFDTVDAAQIFTDSSRLPDIPAPASLH